MNYFIHSRTGALMRSNVKPTGPWVEIGIDQYIDLLENRAQGMENPKIGHVFMVEREAVIGIGTNRLVEHYTSFDVVGHTNIGDWLASQTSDDVEPIPVILVVESET